MQQSFYPGTRDAIWDKNKNYLVTEGGGMLYSKLQTLKNSRLQRGLGDR